MSGLRFVFRDEHGFTTTSMVLSLLVTLSLLFVTAQVYRVNSAAAEVQDVADSAALAAENQVAEFMLVARFCDGVVLSLSLTAIVTTGLGIAALCTPVTAPASEALLKAARHLFDARDSFSNRATSALDKLQKALPFFSAACAVSVARANNVDSEGSNYLGVALLVPSKGEPISLGAGDKGEDVLEDADEQADDIRDKAEEAEEAAEKANECKERAFLHDCGYNPNYCMYERAAHLAALSGGENPLYSSVDTWSFSAALDRARSYYLRRMSSEQAVDGSVGEQVRSTMRARFYAYAWEQVAGGYVWEDEDSFEADFPRLPKNTAEMRQTELYFEGVYLITNEEEGATMHAYTGCPGAVGETLGYGSIEYMESTGLRKCPICGFRASTLGKVAAASSSIENGFEYHYDIVAREAEEYEKARREADEQKEKVEDQAGDLLDRIGEAIRECADKRIDPKPPGRFGTVAFVANVGTTSAAGGFASGFVSDAGSLGTRVAVSAATLVDEGSDEGKTVINSLLDGLREDGGVLVGAAGIVLDAWSWMLKAYCDGQSAVVDGVEAGLDSLPLVGTSGLGAWASEKLTDAIAAVGLQPAKIGALKPVILNSAHVAAKADGSFASAYVGLKQRIIGHPLVSTDLFSAVMTEAERAAIERVGEIGDSVEIASIELLGEGGPSIPITIPIPDAAKAEGVGLIQSVFEQLRSFHAETAEVRAWE